MNKYSFDVNRRGNQFTIEGLHRGDNGMRVFEFCFSSGGEPFPLPEECIATLYAHLPCGTKIFDSCDVVSDTVVYVLKGGAEGASLTVSAGKAECEIRITATDGKIITSPKFTILIDDVLQDDSAIEAADDFSALTDALGRVLEAESGLDSKVDKIEGAEGNVVVFGPDGELKDSGVSNPASKEYATTILNGHNLKKDETVHPYLQMQIKEKLGKVYGAEGNIVVFEGDGNICDSGIGTKELICSFVIIYDTTGKSDSSNHKTLNKYMVELSKGKIPLLIIKKESTYYPAIFTSDNSYPQVYGILPTEALSITFSEKMSYSIIDYVVKSGDFSETNNKPASQAITAKWVKQLINDTVAEGAW